MLKEFFGSSVEDALEKAAWKLNFDPKALSFTKIPQTFSRPGKGTLVGILVDCDKLPQKSESCDEVKSSVEYENIQGIVDPKERAEKFLAGVLGRMGLDFKIKRMEKGENLVLSVEFGKDQIDIRRAEARELRSSLQFLVNRVLYGQSSEESRVIIDFGGKLEERTEQMKDLARELAESVKKTRRAVNINLMDSQDRRLIHQALAEMKDIKTSGRGEERFRILSIEPAGSDENQKDA